MEKKKQVAYSLPTTTIEKLKEASKEKQLNMSVIVQLALEEYFRKEDKGVRE